MKRSFLSARFGAGIFPVGLAIAAGIPMGAWANADEIFKDRFEQQPLFYGDANGVTVRCPEADA